MALPPYSSFGGGLAGALIKDRQKKKVAQSGKANAGQTWTYPEKSVAPAAPRAPGIDPANAEADSIISEMLAELGYARESARRQAEASAQAEVRRAQALAQALQQLGMPQLIQGIYQNSGQSLAGMAEGFSGDVRALADASAAEQGNILAGTGQEGAIRNQGANMGDVNYGLHGFIPARGLEQTGAAFAAQAALEPGFALQFGNMKAADVMSEFTKQILGKFADDEAMIRSKRPGLVADARERQSKLADAAKEEAYDLYEAGLISQRELGRRLKLKGWKKLPNTMKGEESDIDVQEVDGNLVAIDKRTGRVQVVYEGRQERDLKTIQLSDGRDVVIDMQTGNVVSTVGGPTPQSNQIRGSNSTGYTIFDAQGNVIGRVPGTKKPGKTEKPWEAAGFDTREQMWATARNLAKETQGKKRESGAPDPENPPMSASAAYDKLIAEGIPHNVAVTVLKRYYPKAKFPKADPGGAVNASYLTGYEPEQQQMILLALNLAANDSDLVKRALLSAMAVESNYRNLNYGDRDSQGVLQQRPSTGWGPPGNPRQDIEQFLRKARKYKNWKGTPGQLAQKIQVSAFPDRYDERMDEVDRILGLSAGVGASAGVGGNTRENIAVDNSWGGTKYIADQLSYLVRGSGLKVTSEKRDRKNTASGGVSDHWVGSKNAYAYDMSGSVSDMDKAARMLLLAFGIRWNGGSIVKNIQRGPYRIQILYRTDVGGNHYDHIHIGVRRVGDSA